MTHQICYLCTFLVFFDGAFENVFHWHCTSIPKSVVYECVALAPPQYICHCHLFSLGAIMQIMAIMRQNNNRQLAPTSAQLLCCFDLHAHRCQRARAKTPNVRSDRNPLYMPSLAQCDRLLVSLLLGPRTGMYD